VKQLYRMIAALVLLVVVLTTCVPAMDQPQTSYDESDTSITIGTPQVSVRHEIAPMATSVQAPVEYQVQPIVKPEQVMFVEPAPRPAARVTLAIFCSLLC
jgi:hypothetical protein